MSPAVSKQGQNLAMARQPRRFQRDTVSEASFSGSDSMSLSPSPTPSARGGGKKKEERMGGLALPDVVRELLKDSSVLRWDARDSVYEVVHGDNFEKRFNDLRKVRNKVKASGTERPFSRMYNFFVLEQGDKWARTGTRFRPRTNVGFPSNEFLAQLKAVESKKNSSSTSNKARAANSQIWASRSSSAPIKSSASPVSHSSSPRASTHPSFSRAQSARSAVTSALARSMKPLLKSRRLSPSDHIGTSYATSLPSASELAGGLEVGAIAQTLLGKRGRAEYLLNEQIIPADMIEVTARRLRVLDRDEVDNRDCFPSANDGDQEAEYHGSDFHAATQECDEDHHEVKAEAEHDTEPMHDNTPTPASYTQGAAMPTPHTRAAFDYDDPSDGFSSGVPSPESVMSLVADFPGSPLNLDEDEAEDDDFSSFVCAPTQPALSTKEGLMFDNLEETAWMSDSFALW